MNIDLIKKLMPERYDRLIHGLCPICGCVVNVCKIKDKSSLNEYTISGMCQECQDKTFDCEN